MYSYNISKNADRKAFDEVCGLIETKYKGLKKERLLIDVDGTQIQIYNAPDGKIKVYNDYEVDAVYIDSDIELTDITK